MADNGSVSVFFSQPDVDRPKYTCCIRRRSLPRETLDYPCNDGSFSANLTPGRYQMRVLLKDRDTKERTCLRRQITVPDSNDCAVYLINDGVEVNEGNVTIEWNSVGATPRRFKCSLNKERFRCKYVVAELVVFHLSLAPRWKNQSQRMKKNTCRYSPLI